MAQNTNTTDTRQLKEEKLYNFLQKALDDYDNGERKNLNLLTEEVCQKNKDKELLKMWMNCFQKKIFSFNNNQVQKQLSEKQIQLEQGQKKYLSDLIVFRMPYLDYDQGPNNHIELLPVFEKFILQLVSKNQNVYIQSIFSHLLDNLVPISYNLKQIGKANEQQITVLDKVFNGKQEVIENIRNIMSKYQINNLNEYKQLEQQDQDFMKIIFSYHPNGAHKMQNFEKIILGQQLFGENIQKLFFIQKQNGTKEDISYLKSNNENSPQEQEKQNMVDSMARKLDWLMLIFFEYINNQFQVTPQQSKQKIIKNTQKQQSDSDSSDESDSEAQIQQQIKKNSQQITQSEQKQLLSEKSFLFDPKKKFNQQQQKRFFNSLLEIFQSDILITHECKFVQFLIFKLCQLDYENCELFISALIKKIQIKSNTIYLQTKINSTFYLMSFVARSNFLAPQTIFKTLTFIMTYISDYLVSNEDRQSLEYEREEMLKEHQLLYYNIQMIMYIVIYRHRNLDDNQLEQICLFLEQNIPKSFKVLNFIQPQVLIQFQMMLKNHYKHKFKNLLVLFIQHQLDHNNYQKQKYSANEKEKLQLYLYYPFDPYLLQYSEIYIKDIYLYWEDAQKQNNQNVAQSPLLCSTAHSSPSDLYKELEEIEEEIQQKQSQENQYQNKKKQKRNKKNKQKVSQQLEEMDSSISVEQNQMMNYNMDDSNSSEQQESQKINSSQYQKTMEEDQISSSSSIQKEYTNKYKKYRKQSFDHAIIQTNKKVQKLLQKQKYQQGKQELKEQQTVSKKVKLNV
ncbi:hypothetical protein PPERSA_07951 [Pseudocohnilembus persalinus]|uniref:Armadillo-type fold n=1 Tax=Pseudocohnilembus persalinus TaxID=266149 RepID=A0A0V0QBD7_PSEPJ|nr:hypothetical protein PPERSA_07951 [Pseudocohnilembus persalinus]|eukprot:KRW99466.1 hypothetical protein PPERSA_07951 [Pseudocohnilembus persalinus]